MSYELCKKCNTWHWGNRYCPDKFLVKSPIWDGDEIDDNWNTVYAYSKDDAAENYVEKVDDNYSSLDEPITVWVQDLIDQKIYIIKVRGESDITYYTEADEGTDIANFRGEE